VIGGNTPILMTNTHMTKTLTILNQPFEVDYTFKAAHICNYGEPNHPNEAKIKTINGVEAKWWSYQTQSALQAEAVRKHYDGRNDNKV